MISADNHKTEADSPPPAPGRRPQDRPRITGKALLVLFLLLVVFCDHQARMTFEHHLRPVLITPNLDLMRERNFTYRKTLQYWKMRLDSLLGRPEKTPRTIALTFNQGPDPTVTPRLLDVLAQNQVKATFFLTGRDAQACPQLTRQIATAGHQLGNYTYSGKTMDLAGTGTLRGELDRTNALIFRLTNRYPLVARLPANGDDFPLLLEIQRQGLTAVLATVNPAVDDYADSGVLARRVSAQASAGGIISLRQDSPITIQALPEIIRSLQNQGYRFITIEEMAQMMGLSLTAAY